MSGYVKTTCGRNSKVVDEACAIYQPKQSDDTGKIIIFTLTGLCILLCIFIGVGFFVIAKPPQASLESVALKNLMYTNTSSSSSSSLYFNTTLAMELRIENPNQGFFEFPTSKGDILYNGLVVGEMKIAGQRLAPYTAVRTEVKTEVSYRESLASSVWFKNDIKRGLIILKIRVKLRGKVHLKVLNKKNVNLKCLIYLNLKDEVIQALWCK